MRIQAIDYYICFGRREFLSYISTGTDLDSKRQNKLFIIARKPCIAWDVGQKKNKKMAF